jgi:hypothetical protein
VARIEPRRRIARCWEHDPPSATLGNMRVNGVRSLDVSCWQCHHRAILKRGPAHGVHSRPPQDRARAGAGRAAQRAGNRVCRATP